MAVALDKFVKQLEDSGIIESGKLANFIPPQASPKDAEELARELIKQQHLTKFQVHQISQGRAKALILGNYTLLEKIGAGGMGQVFKAQHRRMDRIVAIKMLPSALLKDAATVARFEREVRAAAKLEHPNIVAAYDADQANNVHFLVMQFVDGSDLSVLVKKNGPFLAERAVNYILQAARGLEAAHKRGVIHRDIKPSNLLLDREGTVKILDMGLARIDTPGGDVATQAELTGTGTIMGTVDYMAPEQALSTKHADARADIYSLGCTLHYIVTGKAMYDGETMMAKLLAHREEPIPQLRNSQPGVSNELQAVFAKMVAKKIDDRYATMTEVIADLEKCSSGKSTIANLQSSVNTMRDDNINITNVFSDPANTATFSATPKKKTKYTKTGKDQQKLILYGMGAAILGLVILAGIIVSLKTDDGTLIVEVDQPDAIVQVLDAEGKVEIGDKKVANKKTTISVDPGKHRLKIEKDGFEYFTKDFEIASGGKTIIKAHLEREKPNFIPPQVAKNEIPKPITPVAPIVPEKPNATLKEPAFQEWIKTVGSMSANEQAEAVKKKLVELNPGFDGNKVTPVIQNNVVTRLTFLSDAITNISPVSALRGLKVLGCDSAQRGKLTDISPIQGLPLTDLNLTGTVVSDISPLAGMPLTWLSISKTNVADLSPLRGMPLTYLNADSTQVSDVSPLIGCTQLKNLSLIGAKPNSTSVAALKAALPGCEIKWNDPSKTTTPMPAAPVSPVASNKPINTFNDPAFQAWAKGVAAMTAAQKIDAVTKKMQELNPGFSGKFVPKFDQELVTELQITEGNAFDLSPLRAIPELKILNYHGGGSATGYKLTDFSPLTGMQLTRLSFSGEVSDLSPLVGMPLQILYFGYSKVTDLSPLKNMKLIELGCGHTGVSDLSPLRGMPLTKLSCRYTGVTDLSPLEGMSLTSLDLLVTKVKDLSPLKGMPLTELEIDGTPISNLAPLRGMPLERINLPGTQVSDLEPLRGMKLKTIVCLGTPVSDISPLLAMTSLTHVNLQKTNVSPADIAKLQQALPKCKISADDPMGASILSPTVLPFKDPAMQAWAKGVATLPATQRVDAVTKKMQEINSGFSNGKLTPKIEQDVITELQVTNGYALDITPLRAFPELKVLSYLSQSNQPGTRLADISPLAGMQLTRLILHNTDVPDLSPLEGMPLTTFECGWSKLTDLSPLRNMKLTDLSVGSTKISDLSPLKGMPLTKLFASGLPISDISVLQGMPLTYLVLSDTQVKDISPLQGMPLTQIKLDSTPVSDISPLMNMSTLLLLNLQRTSISPADIAKLQQALPKCKIQSDNATASASPTPAVPTPVATTSSTVSNKPTTMFKDPTLQAWAVGVVAMPVPQQVEAVTKKLQEFNPRFRGKLTPKTEQEIVAELQITEGDISDLSPLRAFPALKVLQYSPVSNRTETMLFDLSPLAGMKLTELTCSRTRVSDLSPLEGMQLTKLHLKNCPVSDLSPLKGMPLTILDLGGTKVTDLSPLVGMSTLAHLSVASTKVTPANVVKLQEALPNCKITWDDPEAKK